MTPPTPQIKAVLILLIAATFSPWVIGAQPNPAKPGSRDVFLQLINRPRVSLDAKVQSEIETNRLVEIHFTFRSEQTQRVPGLLVKQLGNARRPVVISLHGTGSNKDSQLPLLRDLARRGFAAVAMDGRYHGERTKIGKGSAEYEEAMIRAFREGKEHPFLYDTVWDVMRLIDYLETRPDADARRIGLIGFSKGGMETYLAAAVDRRIAAAAPLIGVQCFRWALDNNQWQPRVGTFQRAMDTVARESGVKEVNTDFVRRFYDRVVPGIYSQFDAPAMLPLIAPRPLLVMNGELDDRTPLPGVMEACEAARKAYQAVGAEEKFELRIQKQTGHKVTEESLKGAIEWLVRALRLE